MTKILYIPNGSIIATGTYTDNGDVFQYIDRIIPKHIVSGYAFADVTLPQDFLEGKYLYQNNNFVLNTNWVDPNTTN